MAIELDLHSANSTVALEHAGSTNDQERSRVIWGCYLVDTYFSVVLGRPVMLRSLDIVNAVLPSSQCSMASGSHNLPISCRTRAFRPTWKAMSTASGMPMLKVFYRMK